MRTTFVDNKGVQTEDEDKAFAKEISGTQQQEVYFTTHNNYPYDPQGPDSNREKNLNLKLKIPKSYLRFIAYTKYFEHSPFDTIP